MWPIAQAPVETDRTSARAPSARRGNAPSQPQPSQRGDSRAAAADEAFRGHEAEYALHARYPWDIHPTDRGHEALARAFAEASED
jgi:hypothetical protein